MPENRLENNSENKSEAGSRTLAGVRIFADLGAVDAYFPR